MKNMEEVTDTAWDNFLKMYYISAGQTSLLSSVSRDEYFILIIRQLTSLASSASVMQISGGSTTPLAGPSFFFFLLALPTFLSSAIFSTQRALRASPLYPPLQMDKYKEITGFDVYSVKTVNVLYQVYKHATA